MKKLIKLAKLLSKHPEERSIILKLAQTLDDFRPYYSAEEPYGGRFHHDRSIGFELSEDPEAVEIAKNIMSKTKDKWVFIAFDSIENIESKVKSDDFADWLRSKEYPADSKILIVGSYPFENDFTSPNWILHDIIGHSASNKFSERLRGNKAIWGGGSIYEQPGIKDLIDALWDIIPSDMQNASTDTLDKTCDIIASIIFEDLSKEAAMRIIPSLPVDKDEEWKMTKGGMTYEWIVEQFFLTAEEWIHSLDGNEIKVGNNSVNIITPW
jgi:hypothetical protein